MRLSLLLAGLFVSAVLLTGCEGSKEQQQPQPFVPMPKDMDTSIETPMTPAKQKTADAAADASSNGSNAMNVSKPADGK